MKRRTAFLITAAALLLALTTVLILRFGPLRSMPLPLAYPTDVRVMSALPTPGVARSAYVNSQYGYSVQYPSDWPLKAPGPGVQVRVYMIADPRTPEATAFDIQCAVNPNRLDAESWWKQTDAADPTAQGVGILTLASGTSAYVSVGHGQTGYTIYTMVYNTSACQIIAYEADPANAQIITTTVNTFRWQ